MDPEPTTPVRVPKAVSTYTPSTQDPDLRSQINTVLLRDGHVSKIQETLLHALHANPTNWPTLVQNHALALLRSGEISTFPALMTRVLDDIREDDIAARKHEGQTNGTNGSGKAGEKGGGKGKGQNGVSLAMPKNVVEEGAKITRECLELVCEVGQE